MIRSTLSPSDADPPEADPLVLVGGADDNFAIGLAGMLYSALVNLKKGTEVYVYILDGGIRQTNQERLERVLASVAHVTVHHAILRPDLTRIQELCFNEKRISRATYLKLLIPDLLPREHQRALYLDSDMIVECDLNQLWALSGRRGVLQAVRDYSIQRLSHPRGVARYRELNLSDAPYFNAGMMLIDLARWRTQRISERVIAYLREYAEYVVYEDQDGLNAVIAGEWEELDPRWNQQQVIHDQKEFDRIPESPFKQMLRTVRGPLVEEPYILHFSSAEKPWRFVCHHPERSRFLWYLRRSGWFTTAEWVQYQVAYLGWMLRHPRAATRPLRHALRKRMQPAASLPMRKKTERSRTGALSSERPPTRSQRQPVGTEVDVL